MTTASTTRLRCSSIGSSTSSPHVSLIVTIPLLLLLVLRTTASSSLGRDSQRLYLRAVHDPSRRSGHFIEHRSSVTDTQRNQRWRQLTTVATTECNVVRQNTYLAELQLSYSYEAEFVAGSFRGLSGIKDALVHAVAEALNDCDENEQPMFQVRSSGVHEFSKTATCVPSMEGNFCSVVNGTTVILLDSQSSLAREKALSAIESALADTAYLNLFASSVRRTEFLAFIRESLVVASPDGEDGSGDGSSGSGPRSATAAIVAASASVSFVVASIFGYGFVRREQRKSSDPVIRHRFAARRLAGAVTISPAGGRLRRHRPFFPLDENESTVPNNSFPLEALPTARFDIAAGQYVETKESAHDEKDGSCDDDDDGEDDARYSPTATSWSVSDLTSESGSILSTLSRTTSKLERIEESEKEDGDSDSWEDSSSSYRPRKRRQEEEQDAYSASDGEKPNTAPFRSYRTDSTYYRRTVELYDGEFQSRARMDESTDLDDDDDDDDGCVPHRGDTSCSPSSVRGGGADDDGFGTTGRSLNKGGCIENSKSGCEDAATATEERGGGPDERTTDASDSGAERIEVSPNRPEADEPSDDVRSNSNSNSNSRKGPTVETLDAGSDSDAGEAVRTPATAPF